MACWEWRKRSTGKLDSRLKGRRDAGQADQGGSGKGFASDVGSSAGVGEEYVSAGQLDSHDTARKTCRRLSSPGCPAVFGVDQRRIESSFTICQSASCRRHMEAS